MSVYTVQVNTTLQAIQWISHVDSTVGAVLIRIHTPNGFVVKSSYIKQTISIPASQHSMCTCTVFPFNISVFSRIPPCKWIVFLIHLTNAI